MSYYIVQYDLIETKQNKTFSHEILSSFWNQKMMKASSQHWTLNTPWCLLACIQGFLRHNNQMTVRRAGWERAAGSLSVTCDLCKGAAFLCRCSQWVNVRVRLQHCYSATMKLMLHWHNFPCGRKSLRTCLLIRHPCHHPPPIPALLAGYHRIVPLGKSVPCQPPQQKLRAFCPCR